MVHGRVPVLAAGPPSAGGGHGPGCGERRRGGGGWRGCSRGCNRGCSRKAHGGGAPEGARRHGAPRQLPCGARRARHRRNGGAGARAGCARRRGLCYAARCDRRGRRGRDRHRRPACRTRRLGGATVHCSGCLGLGLQASSCAKHPGRATSHTGPNWMLSRGREARRKSPILRRSTRRWTTAPHTRSS